jgi:hypothetical protein
MQLSTRRSCCFGVGLAASVAFASADAQAATAKRLGQPISAYSASLFGKKNLSAAQTQTLTADPDDPLFGSTSVEYDVGIVHITGFGFGPGYEKWDPPSRENTDSNLITPSGFSIEVFQGFETVMVDLAAYLAEPSGTPTGYIQTFWQLTPNPEDSTGKYIPGGDQIFICKEAAFPEGVDTHYLEFQYNDGVPDIIPASYRVYDSTVNRPSGATVDFMASGDPSEPDITSPGQIIDAVVIGTAVPEPAAVILLTWAFGLALLRPTRR